MTTKKAILSILLLFVIQAVTLAANNISRSIEGPKDQEEPSILQLGSRAFNMEPIKKEQERKAEEKREIARTVEIVQRNYPDCLIPPTFDDESIWCVTGYIVITFIIVSSVGMVIASFINFSFAIKIYSLVLLVGAFCVISNLSYMNPENCLFIGMKNVKFSGPPCDGVMKIDDNPDNLPSRFAAVEMTNMSWRTPKSDYDKEEDWMPDDIRNKIHPKIASFNLNYDNTINYEEIEFQENLVDKTGINCVEYKNRYYYVGKSLPYYLVNFEFDYDKLWKASEVAPHVLSKKEQWGFDCDKYNGHYVSLERYITDCSAPRWLYTPESITIPFMQWYSLTFLIYGAVMSLMKFIGTEVKSLFN